MLYYGKHNHPEAKAVLNDNNNVYLVNNIKDVLNLNIDSNSNIFFHLPLKQDILKAKMLKEKSKSCDVECHILMLN